MGGVERLWVVVNGGLVGVRDWSNNKESWRYSGIKRKSRLLLLGEVVVV